MVCYHNWMCLFFSEIYFNTNLVTKKLKKIKFPLAFFKQCVIIVLVFDAGVVQW